MALYRHATARQLIKFCLVGVFNTTLDFSVYLFLTRVFDFWSVHLVLASAVSFLCGVTSSYLLNYYWTFRRGAGHTRFLMVKFLVVATAGMTWNAAILYVLMQLGVYDIIAKVFATACVIVWNFTLQKKWTFKM